MAETLAAQRDREHRVRRWLVRGRGGEPVRGLCLQLELPGLSGSQVLQRDHLEGARCLELPEFPRAALRRERPYGPPRNGRSAVRVLEPDAHRLAEVGAQID